MPDELTFYTHPQSRGRIVRWMLEEIGQPYRTELLEYDTTMKAPALRRRPVITCAVPIIAGCSSSPARSSRRGPTRPLALWCRRSASE